MKLKPNRLYWYDLVEEDKPELVYSITEKLILFIQMHSKRGASSKLKDISSWNNAFLIHFKEVITK